MGVAGMLQELKMKLNFQFIADLTRPKILQENG